jgi:hypothetical protein
LIRKALYVNRTAAEITDAQIDAMYGVEKFEKKPINEKNQIWEETYSATVESILTRTLKIKKGSALSSAVDGVEKYLNLPHEIDNSRKRNWEKIHSTILEVERKRIDPFKNFMEEITKLTDKKKQGQTLSAKAIEVCTAASLYADLMERKGNNWLTEYREAMKQAYPRLRETPGLVESIIALR